MIKFIVLHKSGGTFTTYRTQDELIHHIGQVFKWLRDRTLIVQKDEKAYVMERIESHPVELQKRLNEIVRSL